MYKLITHNWLKINGISISNWHNYRTDIERGR